MSEMKVSPEELQKMLKGSRKKILKLHLHPEQIKRSISELAGMAEDETLRFLFEDIGVLVGWALERLPLIPPEKTDAPGKDAPEEEITMEKEIKSPQR